jgi:hypothetical protein
VVEMGNEDASNGFNYLVSFYWAFQTISTVGYGDINAAGSSLEQLAAVFAMIIGTGLYSYTIGNMSSIIASIDSDNEEILNRIHTLKSHSKKIQMD